MEGQHKAYQDLPIKPHGSRSINHIGGSVTGNETPTANPVIEELPVVSVEDTNNSDETTETEPQQLQGPAIEVQTDPEGNVTDVYDETLEEYERSQEREASLMPLPEEVVRGIEADAVVADEVQEIEPPAVKKKGIK